MPRIRPHVAKLAAPVIGSAFPRPQLFEGLDQARANPVVWVCGPPGSGKTWLVATYFRGKRVPSPWYRIDSTDADPAAFLHTLAQLARREWRLALPRLTPEHLTDLDHFARRFFRRLYAHFAPGAAIVFDDQHELPPESPTHAVLRAACDELPSGVNLIVVSRNPPEGPFARARLHGSIAMLDWQALRLGDDEARAFAAYRGLRDPQLIDRIAGRAKGWMAGLALLTASGSASADRATAGGHDQLLFDYFAGEVFQRLPADRQELFLAAAFAPVLTRGIAAALAGDAAFAAVEALHRSQLFITRTDGTPPRYVVHDLFREFLRAEARRRLDEDALRARVAAAARATEADGLAELALPLYLDAGEWEAAERLVLAHAPAALDAGRFQTVLGWMQRFPADRLDASPDLLLWHGLAQLAADPSAARATLERAHRAYGASGDVLARLLVCSAVIDAYFIEWARFQELDAWIERFEALLAEAPQFPSPEVELKVLTSGLTAISYRLPGDPRARALSERLLHLVDVARDPNRIAGALLVLINYLMWSYQRGVLHRLEPLVRRLMDDSNVSGLNRIWLAFFWSGHAWFDEGEYDEAQRLLARALEIAEAEGLGFFRAHLVLQRLALLAPHADLDRVEALLVESERVMRPDHPNEAGRYYYALAGYALRKGDLSRALAAAEKASSLLNDSGVAAHVFLVELLLARVLTERGEWDLAERMHKRAATRMGFGDGAIHHLDGQLLEAYWHVKQGDRDAARSATARALALGRRLDARTTVCWIAEQVDPVLRFALREGIEVEYASTLVRHHRVRADDAVGERWPWPVAIRTLGVFEVVVDGRPLPAVGKAVSKPLLLLQALIAFGGRQVSIARLGEACWPEADGDAAENAFHVTLSRLRKLLPFDGVLVLGDRKLSLDEGYCALDALAFERGVDALLSANGAALGEGVEPMSAELRRLLGLYRGPFLADEPDEPWIAMQRQRLRTLLSRLVSAAAAAARVGGHADLAKWLLLEGLDREPGEESFYRQLMSLHLERGAPSEAARVYAQCRDALAALLGTKPSRETEALYARIRTG